MHNEDNVNPLDLLKSDKLIDFGDTVGGQLFKAETHNLEPGYQGGLFGGEELFKAAKKAGEGSRGGHVIGHTSSGKPIYGSHDSRAAFSTAKQGRYKDWSSEDHREAAYRHEEASMAHDDADRDGAAEHHSQMAEFHGHMSDGKHLRAEKVYYHMTRDSSEAKKRAKEAAKHFRTIGAAASRAREEQDASFREDYEREQSKKSEIVDLSGGSDLLVKARAMTEGDIGQLGDGSLVVKKGDILVPFAKAGEGSRGGHVIGHTSSGKPVYAHHAETATNQPHHERHRDLAAKHKGWSAVDHEEAALQHSRMGEAHDKAQQGARRSGKAARHATAADYHDGMTLWHTHMAKISAGSDASAAERSAARVQAPKAVPTAAEHHAAQQGFGAARKKLPAVRRDH